jgi:hypothetical protein
MAISTDTLFFVGQQSGQSWASILSGQEMTLQGSNVKPGAMPAVNREIMVLTLQGSHTSLAVRPFSGS